MRKAQEMYPPRNQKMGRVIVNDYLTNLKSIIIKLELEHMDDSQTADRFGKKGANVTT